MISSKQVGCSFFMNPFIPSDSSWNTPFVSPEEISFNASLSFNISSVHSGISTPYFSFTDFCAVSMIVRLRSIRRSFFRFPRCSASVMLYWQTRYPVSGSTDTGNRSSHGTGVGICPQACVEAAFLVPSSLLAIFHSFWYPGSELIKF